MKTLLLMTFGGMLAASPVYVTGSGSWSGSGPLDPAPEQYTSAGALGMSDDGQRVEFSYGSSCPGTTGPRVALSWYNWCYSGMARIGELSSRDFAVSLDAGVGLLRLFAPNSFTVVAQADLIGWVTITNTNTTPFLVSGGFSITPQPVTAHHMPEPGGFFLVAGGLLLMILLTRLVIEIDRRCEARSRKKNYVFDEHRDRSMRD